MTISGKRIFQRQKEDFTCGHCHVLVIGDGYTNHCPRCLYGKHVDVFPGDRLEVCGGFMEPIRYEKDDGQEKLTHRCLRCGQVRKNRIQKNDDFEALLAVARKQATAI